MMAQCRESSPLSILLAGGPGSGKSTIPQILGDQQTPSVDLDFGYARKKTVATPMMRIGDNIAAVDLFLDVLVDTGGDYRIVDRDESEQAVAAGLISPSEARAAEVGLARLVQWIESGRPIRAYERLGFGSSDWTRPSTRTALTLIPPST